jgi:hypothetical protein
MQNDEALGEAYEWWFDENIHLLDQLTGLVRK